MVSDAEDMRRLEGQLNKLSRVVAVQVVRH